MPDGITPLDITKSIAATLIDHGLTGVYGFTHTLASIRTRLMAAWEAWVKAGHHLGNHTHLHAPLRWMSGDQYCADIDKAEGLIGHLIGMAPERYFRYAMDMAGETESKRGQVETIWASGYRNAPITAWFGDFTSIIPYTAPWCPRTRTPSGCCRRPTCLLRSASWQHTRSWRGGCRPGHPSIWLVHEITIATDTLGTYLDRFVESGVEFVPLREAGSHPVHFAMPPSTPSYASTFSNAYRERFGERPTDTRERCRARRASNRHRWSADRGRCARRRAVRVRPSAARPGA